MTIKDVFDGREICVLAEGPDEANNFIEMAAAQNIDRACVWLERHNRFVQEPYTNKRWFHVHVVDGIILKVINSPYPYAELKCDYIDAKAFMRQEIDLNYWEQLMQ
jgi:hypothetical protein